MNDKAIRKILIEYLHSENPEARIYQEKMIGSSVCDVMSVFDSLNGYEIKSDCDNFQRLSRQIKSYTEFFDYNYLVVSDCHKDIASSKVPESWGIILIQDNGIHLQRKARRNKGFSLRVRLSVLWKIELKNILVRNKLPDYASKSKEYIISRIVDSVNPEILSRHITEELLKRDYSIYGNTAEYSGTEEGINPLAELVDTVSEQNFEKFTLDKWIEIYNNAKGIRDKKEQALRPVRASDSSHRIKYTDISVSMGVPWISVHIIEEFIKELLEIIYDYKLVSYEPVTGSWHIYNKNGFRGNLKCMYTYGTDKWNCLHIIEATLNLREIKICNSRGKYDETETLAVLEKQKLINQKFSEWIWQDEDRIWEIEEAYNNMFYETVPETINVSRVTIPEMNPEYKLYDYQKYAVQRITNQKNTLLAYDVGSGKTLIMIAAAMKMRREGISRKNMFVVPNNITVQWEKTFSDMYPEAKILTVDPDTFKPELREKVLHQLQCGDYDGIIIAYSCFEMIPLSQKYLSDNLRHRLLVLADEANKISAQGDSVTAVNREMSYVSKLVSELMKSTESILNEITFDKLEINTLFVDEAHNFKNIPLRTRMRNVSGINTKGSVKCLDMLEKVRFIQEQSSGNGVVFATGTPLCNSISDTYSMQMYLQPDELKKNGLDIFDNWIKTFAKPEHVCEIDVDVSKYRFRNRFSRFFNLPELSSMFSHVAVFHAVDNEGQLPEMNGYNDIIIEKNTAMSAYMKKICQRTEIIRAGRVYKTQDNMLKVSSDGRKAALDLNLVHEIQSYDESSKIKKCADQVIKYYHVYEGSTQIVFCDISTPKHSDFCVYEKLRSILISRGIHDKEIAFIHSYSTDLKKLELYDKFNRGEIRILIGSTVKLGTGANVQKRLKALHHLDAPWRPADMVQREGRILRMGNENNQVFIFRYITEGSFDAYSWQILETKQRFISQFLSGSAYQRSISDLESNVLSYGEVKALALSSPIMRDYAEKENYLRSFRILSNSHIQHLSKVRNELETAEVKLEEINAKLKESEEKTVSEKRYQKLLTQKEQFTAMIDNAKKELRKKNPYTEQIQQLQKEIEDIRKKIHEETFENSVDPALSE